MTLFSPFYLVLPCVLPDSELTLGHLGLLSVPLWSVCVSREGVSCVLALVVAAGHTLRPGAGPFASHGQTFLKALRGEVINHGVQAAVEASQTQSDGVQSTGKSLHSTVGQCLCPHQGVQEEDGVVGDEADDEDTQMDQNHP